MPKVKVRDPMKDEKLPKRTRKQIQQQEKKPSKIIKNMPRNLPNIDKRR